MNELVIQLRTVDADVWYAVFVILGAAMCALIVSGTTAANALKGMILGIFGGALIVLALTSYFPSIRVRLMCVIAGVAGLVGNYAVHWVYDRKSTAGSWFESYLKNRYGGQTSSKTDSPRNPSQEDNQP